MTDTANLGLPFIDASQAQKHVTHNEALRILDAVIQVSVIDKTLTAPPAGPVDGDRHVVASGATGVWAGQVNAIATWQDGAWAFLAPKIGWCTWSVADDMLFVFDGTVWRDFRSLPTALDNALHVGINTVASSPNLLSVKSNDALFTAIEAADGGTGDMRIQVSKETSGDTASVVFADNFSGRAEFGLVGSDTFKLKVSSDGAGWTEAFNIDPASGNLTLPRGVALTGVVSPAQITADQDDFNPAGLATASVLQIYADAARNVSGIAGGAEGRCIVIVNVGSYPVTLLNESSSSAAANRFTFSGNMVIATKQAAILRYDGTAARWQAIAGGGLNGANNLSDLASAGTALDNLGGTTVGKALFTAEDADAALASIGGAGLDKANTFTEPVLFGDGTRQYGNSAATVAVSGGAYQEWNDGTRTLYCGADSGGTFLGTYSSDVFSIRTSQQTQWRFATGGLGRASSFQTQVNIIGSNGISMKGSSAGGLITFIDFADVGLTQCGAINVDQTAHTTAYATSSDMRAKPNRSLLTADVAIDVINRLKIWDFDKDGNAIRGVGVLAQEAYETCPRMVQKGDDNPNLTPGDDEYVGWSAEKAYPVPYLIVALQEALRRIAALEAALKF